MQKNTKTKLIRFYALLLCLTNKRFNSSWLHSKISLHQVLPPLDKTNKVWYRIERENYRITSSLVRKGELITVQNYRLYKQIAIKYNWPYIKETYDD